MSRHIGVNEGSRWFFWKGDTSHNAQVTISDHNTDEITCTMTIGVENPSGQPIIWCAVQKKGSDKSSTTDRVGVSFTDSQPKNYIMNVSPGGMDFQAHLVEPQSSISQPPFVELYSRVVEQGRKQAAIRLIADVVPSLINLEILIEKGVPLLYAVFDTYSLPVALSGEGVQSLLRLTLELASRPGGVVLIEEPEVHQHPGAIRQSARAIWAAIRRDIQVVISTHSLELIDALLSEVEDQEELDKMSVYRLLLKDGCLRSSRTAGSDIAFARTEIGDDLR